MMEESTKQVQALALELALVLLLHRSTLHNP
jgi:hypothetical protein